MAASATLSLSEKKILIYKKSEKEWPDMLGHSFISRNLSLNSI